MKNTAYTSNVMIRLECLSVKWEVVVTVLVAFCAIAAIVLGIVWMFLRKDYLFFIVLGVSSCYLIGRNI